MIETALQRQGGTLVFRQDVGQIAQQPVGIKLFERAWLFTQQNGTGAEGFDHEAEIREHWRRRVEAADSSLFQFNDRRNEQDLPFNATRQTRGFHLFIDKTFMRGVLIDNDETVACLRDDVSAVDLRPRRAKRRIVIVVQRHCGAHIGARRNMIETRLIFRNTRIRNGCLRRPVRWPLRPPTGKPIIVWVARQKIEGSACRCLVSRDGARPRAFASPHRRQDRG